jgi:hypothetical protein
MVEQASWRSTLARPTDGGRVGGWSSWTVLSLGLRSIWRSVFSSIRFFYRYVPGLQAAGSNSISVWLSSAWPSSLE